MLLVSVFGIVFGCSRDYNLNNGFIIGYNDVDFKYHLYFRDEGIIEGEVIAFSNLRCCIAIQRDVFPKQYVLIYREQFEKQYGTTNEKKGVYQFETENELIEKSNVDDLKWTILDP